MAELAEWYRDLAVRVREVRSEASGWGRYGFKPSRRERTVVVTDSSASLPELVDQLPLAQHLRIVPMPVMIGDQIYAEGSSELAQQLPMALAAGTPVRTSRPAPGVFREVYQQIAEAGYGRIISIHIAAALSGTVDAARMAAENCDIPVEVIDSQTSGMALGNAVLDVLLRSRTGLSLESLVHIATESSSTSRAFFTVPNLDQLRRGGRIGTLAGLLGQLLQVKPVLTLDDGAVTLVDRPRSTVRAIESMIRLVRDETTDSPSRIAVHGYGNLDAAHELAGRVQDLSTVPVPVIPLPAVLAAHLGLGSLAITINPELKIDRAEGSS